MAKTKNKFYCNECGYETSKWVGQCPSCKSWNTIVEVPASFLVSSSNTSINSGLINEKPVSLKSVQVNEASRISTKISEFDRVLGGGIVRGSLILLGGDPGIGKSTILMQLCINISNEYKILYVSGEESANQIKLRVDRLGDVDDSLLVYCNNNIENILNVINMERPDIVILDSIQTMSNKDSLTTGSVSQIREVTSLALKAAKTNNIPFIIVGHVTKDGLVAGPKVLEHMVDTVLYFEGDKNASYRVIRSVKNRFGASGEIGVFEMTQGGLKEVKNPSKYMIQQRVLNASGCTITAVMEGSRPLLLELQVLINSSVFQIPRRTAAGMDYNRVNLLIAVLEKRLKLMLTNYDVYINITGGMRINEPSMDLALILALISAYKNIEIRDDILIFGEVGLSGEVRGVDRANYRVREAIKMGFKRIIIPKTNLKELNEVNKEVEIIGISFIDELLRYIK